MVGELQASRTAAARGRHQPTLLVPGQLGKAASIKRKRLISSTCCEAAVKGRKERKRKLQNESEVTNQTHTREKRARAASTVEIRQSQTCTATVSRRVFM